MRLHPVFRDVSFVAFDFDGTLTDYVQADTLALEQLRLSICPQVNSSVFLDVAVREIMAFHDRVEHGESDPLGMDEERLTRTLQHFGATLTPELLAFYIRRLHVHTVALPGAQRLLDALLTAGKPLAVLTNAYDGAVQRARIAHCFPGEPFDAVVISGEVGAMKPDPRPFRVMAQTLGLPPESGVYIGDIPRYDVTGARNAGMRAVAVHASGRVRQQGLELGAALAVSSLSELLI